MSLCKSNVLSSLSAMCVYIYKDFTYTIGSGPLRFTLFPIRTYFKNMCQIATDPAPWIHRFRGPQPNIFVCHCRFFVFLKNAPHSHQCLVPGPPWHPVAASCRDYVRNI